MANPTTKTVYRWYKLAEANVMKDVGNIISNVADLSGNAGDLDTVTGSLLWVDNVLNSKPVMRFAGAESIATAFGVTITQPTTICVVWKKNTLDGNVQVTYSGYDGANIQQLTSNDEAVIYYGGAAVIPYTKSSFSDFMFSVVVFDGASSKIYEDNIEKASGNGGTEGLTGIRFGSYLDSGYWFKGDIAEIMIYQGDSTLQELQDLSNYVYLEYGISDYNPGGTIYGTSFDLFIQKPLIAGATIDFIPNRPILEGLAIEFDTNNFFLTVKDKTGTVIEGATVNLYCADTTHNIDLETDADGLCYTQLQDLQEYKLTISNGGNQTYAEHYFTMNYEQHLILNWEIKLSNIVPIMITKQGAIVNSNPTNSENNLLL